MKQCLICGKNISHTPGNTQHCNRHLPKKHTPLPKEETVTISYSYFKKLQRALELYEELEKYIEKIKETI